MVALPLPCAWQLLYWLIYLQGCMWVCRYTATAASTYCQDRGKPSEGVLLPSLEREVSRLLNELIAASPPLTHMEFGGDSAEELQILS